MELVITGNISYSLLAFIPALLNTGILLYILLYLPRSKTTDIFACIVLSLIFWQVEDTIMRLSSSVDFVRFWDSILCLSWLGIAPLSFHFASLYASLKIFYRRTSLFLVYVPFVIFYLVYMANIQRVQYVKDETWGWINKPRPGTLEEFQLYWISIMILATLFILIRHAARIRNNRNKKIQAWIIAIGCLIPALQGITTQVIFPLFLSKSGIPVTSTFMSFFSIATILALNRYKLFHILDSVHNDSLLEGLNRLVLIISPEKKIIYLNQYASRVLGISQEEEETVLFAQIFPPYEDDYRKYLDDVFEKVSQGETINNYSSSFVTGENKRINVIMTSSLVVNNNVKLGVLLLANDITEMVTALKDLELEKLKRENEIAEATMAAQENERKSIGGELHDNINQILVTALLYMSMMKRESKIELPYINDIDGLINNAIREIRTLSHTLIAPSLNESELSLALDNIILMTGKAGKLNIEKVVSGINENNISEKIKLNIYRIVQEQFNNIIKYAKAKTVLLKLTQEDGKLLLKIRDDGIGFDTSNRSAGRGIMNMKSRASVNNGEMKIISAPGRGCELNVVFKNFA